MLEVFGLSNLSSMSRNWFLRGETEVSPRAEGWVGRRWREARVPLHPSGVRIRSDVLRGGGTAHEACASGFLAASAPVTRRRSPHRPHRGLVRTNRTDHPERGRRCNEAGRRSWLRHPKNHHHSSLLRTNRSRRSYSWWYRTIRPADCHHRHHRWCQHHLDPLGRSRLVLHPRPWWSWNWRWSSTTMRWKWLYPPCHRSALAVPSSWWSCSPACPWRSSPAACRSPRGRRPARPGLRSLASLLS